LYRTAWWWLALLQSLKTKIKASMVEKNQIFFFLTCNFFMVFVLGEIVKKENIELHAYTAQFRSMTVRVTGYRG
jgi:hypothetical protein